ncbi:deoxyribose-phosphate aldolase [Clostridiales bacterium COT073_COT-073]|nr:deoxyribose-phosphate aldolase [Clostridiales bacterium COT073_COT-073]
MNYAKYIDHTVLKANTTRETVKRICDEAKEYKFTSVCVNPYWVAYATEQLKGSEVKACAVIGFPLGANKTEVKVLETKLAVVDGAEEVDMVINVGALKDKDYAYVKNDIQSVVETAHPESLVKVIIECSELTEEEKIKACELAVEAGADFVKTSTGFGSGGATVEDIKLMKKVVGDRCKVKASTGINNRKICDEFIKAGAIRMGTSKGIYIVNDQEPPVKPIH